MRAAGIEASGKALVGHMLHDKKMDAGTLPFLLARGIGATYLDRAVDLDSIAAFLDASTARRAAADPAAPQLPA